MPYQPFRATVLDSVRISIGIEDVADLIADFEQALEALSRYQARNVW